MDWRRIQKHIDESERATASAAKAAAKAGKLTPKEIGLLDEEIGRLANGAGRGRSDLYLSEAWAEATAIHNVPEVLDPSVSYNKQWNADAWKEVKPVYEKILAKMQKRRESGALEGGTALGAAAAVVDDPDIPDGLSPEFYETLQALREVSSRNPVRTGERSWSVVVGPSIVQVPDAASEKEAVRRARLEAMRARLSALGAAWDESKHPRHPAGSPEGGEFAEDPNAGSQLFEDDDDDEEEAEGGEAENETVPPMSTKTSHLGETVWDGEGNPFKGLVVLPDTIFANNDTELKIFEGQYDDIVMLGEGPVGTLIERLLRPAPLKERIAIARAASAEDLEEAAGALLGKYEAIRGRAPDYDGAYTEVPAITAVRLDMERRHDDRTNKAKAKKTWQEAAGGGRAKATDEGAAPASAEPADPNDTAAIARRLNWVDVTDPDARRALRKAYPMFAEQEAARKKINPIVDRMYAAAIRHREAASETGTYSLPPDPEQDAKLARGAKSAWSKAPSFWRGIGFGALKDLSRTGSLRTKRRRSVDPVSVSASQGEANAFGKGVMIELDAEAVRRAEGSDATRVRYATQNHANEDLDTACDGCAYDPLYGNETETRLRQGAFGKGQIKRIYVTIDDSWQDDKIEEIRQSAGRIAPVVFVPRGYHGSTADARSDG